MSDGLFDLDAKTSPSAEPTPASARDEQIAAIRSGLTEAGINTQHDRKAFIEEVVLAPVESLRALTALQARRVIDRLKTARTESTVSGGSLWDNREEDTWIDRL